MAAGALSADERGVCCEPDPLDHLGAELELAGHRMPDSLPSLHNGGDAGAISLTRRPA